MWTQLARRISNTPVSKRAMQTGPPPRLLAKFEKFQKDDGVPVYLKGGAGDKMLFGLTGVLIAIGMADGLYTLFDMARPKKKK